MSAEDRIERVIEDLTAIFVEKVREMTTGQRFETLEMLEQDRGELAFDVEADGNSLTCVANVASKGFTMFQLHGRDWHALLRAKLREAVTSAEP